MVKTCEPEEFKDCDIVFSGLDYSVAGEIEIAFPKVNLAVFSNAKNYPQDPRDPLVPIVYLDLRGHPEPAESLQGRQGFLGLSNCAAIGLVIPFAAIEAAFGPIDVVSVVTEHVLSGKWLTFYTNLAELTPTRRRLSWRAFDGYP